MGKAELMEEQVSSLTDVNAPFGGNNLQISGASESCSEWMHHAMQRAYETPVGKGACKGDQRSYKGCGGRGNKGGKGEQAAAQEPANVREAKECLKLTKRAVTEAGKLQLEISSMESASDISEQLRHSSSILKELYAKIDSRLGGGQVSEEDVVSGACKQAELERKSLQVQVGLR